MSHDSTLELALRRLLALSQATNTSTTAAAISAAVADLEAQIAAAIDAHAAQRQFVHGTGPLYVAKTRNANQYVDWSEVQNKPSSIPGSPGTGGGSGIDPSTIRIDAAQVISGILSSGRIPFADHNEYTSGKAVQSTDPRLNTKVYTLLTSEPLATGDFIAVDARYPNGVCRRADPSRYDDGCAIGFVAEPYSEWEFAIIYPVGIVRVPMEGVSLSHLGDTVFVDRAIPGRVRLAPPEPPSWVQPVGQVVRIVTEGTVEVLVRYEYRVWNTAAI